MDASQPSDETQKKVEKAVEQWREQLVDFTGRNRLIYYRELKSGTLNLREAEPTRLQQLFAGKRVRLSELYQHPVLLRGGSGDFPEDAEFTEAAKRIRAIARTGLANFEERGIGTTFLTSHLVTWDAGSTSTAKPNAPVLLAPLRIHPLGGSQRDFELELSGEWEVNQTLLIFWSKMFGAQLDPDELSVLAEDQSGDLAELAARVIKMARDTGSIPDLKLDEGQLVGNFLYTNLPMVKDLEGATSVLAANDVIAAIAGDAAATTRVRAGNAARDIDPKRPDSIPPEAEFLVLDADSSQSHVINTVLAGRSTIVEGPPGTGKSQTISNLIASLAAEGKSVLFVAEKRAAIEAVFKRLEAVGLSDLTLDLHTGGMRKKELAEALNASLANISTTARPNVGRRQSEFRQLRKNLVDYERELHRRVEPWKQSSFDVNSELLGYSHVPHVYLNASQVERLTDEEVERVFDLLERWAAGRKSVDWDSPWVDASLADGERAKMLAELVRRLLDYELPLAEQAVAAAEQELNLDLSNRSLRELQAVLLACEVGSRVNACFGPEFWGFDLDRTAAVLAQKSRFGGGAPDYREVTRALKNAQTRRVSKSETKRLVDDASRAAAVWNGLRLGGIPRDAASRLRLGEAITMFLPRACQLKEVLPPRLEDLTLGDLRSGLIRLAETEDVSFLVAQTAELRSQLANAGVEVLVAEIEQGLYDEDSARQILEHSMLLGRKRAIQSRNPFLNTFHSDDHQRQADRYALADRWHLESAAERVMRKVAERALDARDRYPAENSVIEKEAKKKTRHKSLRQLQSEAGQVLTALRPCWMMSPLMVAQSLPAEPLFDYVIFDEASQIRPQEAISAIARGRHLVVAGDRRQLPPSAFFDTGNSDVEDYDEGDETADALTSGYQSILDVTGALLPMKMLTWHYRSRDERLIALSNDHIYGGALTTFPGPQQRSPVTFHKVDHQPASASEVRSNPTEVAKVVDLMVEHAREHPEESLGVIAFGQHHATAIENALLNRLSDEASRDLDDFFDGSKSERVFVKNIERVQGDERDVIILSVGYGKDLNGRVPHRFGPVNQDGGERRINVAASRARSRMEIVASIGSEDLDTGGLGKGPQLLEHLLRFAETGGADTGASEARHPLNPFELAVKSELEELGLRPICQYGVSGFRIDFALPHPDNDGRMVLAVEADGASYHSSETARDRDRLRQQVLEDKGWRFHRIWSTAFFKDPKGEAAKVRAAYDRALRGEADLSPTPFSQSGDRHPTKTKPDRPRFEKGVPIDDHDHRKLVALARWITDDGETLMTEAEIKERMKEELGYQRLGARISDAFQVAIDSARGRQHR